MRYVTNEQRRRQTLFKPTLWAVASWLIFRFAHSLRIDSDMLVVTASPARTALKISQMTDRGMPPPYDSMHGERGSRKDTPEDIIVASSRHLDKLDAA